MQSRQDVIDRHEQLLASYSPMVNEREVIAEVFRALTGQDIAEASEAPTHAENSAMHGNVGAGKASLLGMLTEHFDPSERVLIVEDAPAKDFEVVTSHYVYGEPAGDQDIYMHVDGTTTIGLSAKDLAGNAEAGGYGNVENGRAVLQIVLDQTYGKSGGYMVTITDADTGTDFSIELPSIDRFRAAARVVLDTQSPTTTATAAKATPFPAPVAPATACVTLTWLGGDEDDDQVEMTVAELAASDPRGQDVVDAILARLEPGAARKQLLLDEDDTTIYNITNVNEFRQQAEAFGVALAGLPTDNDGSIYNTPNRASVVAAPVSAIYPAPPVAAAKCISVAGQSFTVDDFTETDNGEAAVALILARLEDGVVRKQLILDEAPFDGQTVYSVDDAAAFREQAEALGEEAPVDQPMAGGISRNW